MGAVNGRGEDVGLVVEWESEAGVVWRAGRSRVHAPAGPQRPAGRRGNPFDDGQPQWQSLFSSMHQPG